MGFGYSEETVEYIDLSKVHTNAKPGETAILRSKLADPSQNYGEFFGISTVKELVEMNAKSYSNKDFLGTRSFDQGKLGPYEWMTWE